MKRSQTKRTSGLSSLVIAIFAMALSLTLLSCSKNGGTQAGNGNSELYGKWQHTKSAMFDSKGAQVMGNVDKEGDPNVKVIEYRKDGTYLEGNQSGKFQFVDSNHVNVSIDGLTGTAKIVLQGDTLEVWNPDGSQMDGYKRMN